MWRRVAFLTLSSSFHHLDQREKYSEEVAANHLQVPSSCMNTVCVHISASCDLLGLQLVFYFLFFFVILVLFHFSRPSFLHLSHPSNPIQRLQYMIYCHILFSFQLTKPPRNSALTVQLTPTLSCTKTHLPPPPPPPHTPSPDPTSPPSTADSVKTRASQTDPRPRHKPVPG